MRSRGHGVEQLPLSDAAAHGTFVPPTLIEIAHIADVEQEVFGPVLHVLRFARENLDRLIGEINATGYGLTFGLHTRIDETISRVVTRVEAGNVYVNRNIIGATVGVQPFGGSGLSGTGPKAGGPLYLGRLLATPPRAALVGLDGEARIPPRAFAPAQALAPARTYVDWLRTRAHPAEAERVLGYLSRSALGAELELAGPVGERNVYALRPRGQVAACARTEAALLVQIGAILATGNVAVVERDNPGRAALASLPAALAQHVVVTDTLEAAAGLRAILSDAVGAELVALQRHVAAREGAILPVQTVAPCWLAAGEDYELHGLLEEVVITTNTAAAGGNASLMSIG